MLEPEQSRHPVGAAYSLNPKNLTAQIFRCFDRRSGNHIDETVTALRRVSCRSPVEEHGFPDSVLLPG